MESLFCCPVCGQSLQIEEGRYVCAGRHSFDRAAKGYVNLLSVNRKHSAEPGDDPESLRSRRAFLQSGAYSPLADALCNAVLDYGGERPVLLDCCCGEGYYTRQMVQALRKRHPESRAAAFDISRIGVKMASSRQDPTEYAVGSIFRIPAADRTFDLATLCFAPFCGKELARVLRPGGTLINVVPGARHLFALKELVYAKPYENDEQGADAAEFERIETRRVSAAVTLSSQELWDLFRMTPYFCRCDEDARERVRQQDSLTTEIDFVLHILKNH